MAPAGARLGPGAGESGGQTRGVAEIDARDAAADGACRIHIVDGAWLVIELPRASRTVDPFDTVAVVKQVPASLETCPVGQEHMRLLLRFVVDEGTFPAHVDDMRGADHDKLQCVSFQNGHGYILGCGIALDTIVKHPDYGGQ